MENSSLIAIDAFCSFHNVDISFVSSIQEQDLITIVFVEETGFIQEEKLPLLEKIVRLYKELEINPEGIGVVLHLLDRIDFLQKENQSLKRRLSRLESLEGNL
ncbi:MerR HTH family regulatory protein [Rhodonellum ikkaensis]|nr:MerR HTH family regulatory protein [Rhodonellum ikkaensis]